MADNIKIAHWRRKIKSCGPILFSPNFFNITALKEWKSGHKTSKTRNITNDFSNIVAILKKEKNKKQYSDVTYIKNNFDLTNLTNNTELRKLIDFNKIKYINKQDVKNYNKVEEFRNK